MLKYKTIALKNSSSSRQKILSSFIKLKYIALLANSIQKLQLRMTKPENLLKTFKKINSPTQEQINYTLRNIPTNQITNLFNLIPNPTPKQISFCINVCSANMLTLFQNIETSIKLKNIPFNFSEVDYLKILTNLNTESAIKLFENLDAEYKTDRVIATVLSKINDKAEIITFLKTLPRMTSQILNNVRQWIDLDDTIEICNHIKNNNGYLDPEIFSKKFLYSKNSVIDDSLVPLHIKRLGEKYNFSSQFLLEYLTNIYVLSVSKKIVLSNNFSIEFLENQLMPIIGIHPDAKKIIGEIHRILQQNHLGKQLLRLFKTTSNMIDSNSKFDALECVLKKDVSKAYELIKTPEPNHLEAAIRRAPVDNILTICKIHIEKTGTMPEQHFNAALSKVDINDLHALFQLNSEPSKESIQIYKIRTNPLEFMKNNNIKDSKQLDLIINSLSSEDVFEALKIIRIPGKYYTNFIKDRHYMSLIRLIDEKQLVTFLEFITQHNLIENSALNLVLKEALAKKLTPPVQLDLVNFIYSECPKSLAPLKQELLNFIHANDTPPRIQDISITTPQGQKDLKIYFKPDKQASTNLIMNRISEPDYLELLKRFLQSSRQKMQLKPITI